MPTNDNANDNDPVTDSCGCVFCDLELEPELVDGEWVHETYGSSRPCTKKDAIDEGADDVYAGDPQ